MHSLRRTRLGPGRGCRPVPGKVRSLLERAAEGSKAQHLDVTVHVAEGLGCPDNMGVRVGTLASGVFCSLLCAAESNPSPRAQGRFQVSLRGKLCLTETRFLSQRQSVGFINPVRKH